MNLQDFIKENFETSKHYYQDETNILSDVITSMGHDLEEELDMDFITEFEINHNDYINEIADSACPVYYSEQLDWLKNDKDSFDCMTEAMELGYDDFGKLLMAGRFIAIERSMTEICKDFIEKANNELK